jgi:hypothetical protein
VPDTVPHSKLTHDGDQDAEIGRAALSAIGAQAV